MNPKTACLTLVAMAAFAASGAWADSQVDDYSGLWVFRASDPISVREINENFRALGEHAALFEASITPTGGRLGIGTDEPTSKLHLYEATNNGDVAISFGSHDIIGEQTSERSRIQLTSAHNNAGHLDFFTKGDAGSSELRVRISENGDVGIGTSNPTGDLSFGAGESSITIATEDDQDDGGLFMVAGGEVSANRGAAIRLYGNEHSQSGNVYISAGNSGALNDKIVFQSRGSSHMIIESDGNVAIGSSKPKSKLEINGHVRPTSADPKSTDCNQDYHLGRMFYSTNDDGFYGCTTDGWVRLDNSRS